MTPSTKVNFLPSEAVKAILAFMTRRHLIALSGVNRQFLHVIDSPPFTKKPLLRLGCLALDADINYDDEDEDEDEDEIGLYRSMRLFFDDGRLQTPYKLKQQWLRYRGGDRSPLSSTPAS